MPRGLVVFAALSGPGRHVAAEAVIHILLPHAACVIGHQIIHPMAEGGDIRRRPVRVLPRRTTAVGRASTNEVA